MRRVVWAMPAMEHFARVLHETLPFKTELAVGTYAGDCDLVYIVGLYDPPTYNHTLSMTARAKRTAYHWCGTDVMMLPNAHGLREGIHVAESENLRQELRAKGVDATTVMMPTMHHFDVTPLPDKPQVACYLGTDPRKYGNDILKALGEAMPEVSVIGYMYGQYNPEQMTQLVAESSIYVRLTAHDGSAASAREFMEAGRRVVVTNEIPHANVIRRDDLPKLISTVRRLLKETEPDTEAAAYWKQQNSVERFHAEIAGVLDA